MTRSLPLVATIVVALAAALMVALGVWQLDRAEEKGALLDRYGMVDPSAAPISYPRSADAIEANLYRRVRVRCEEVLSTRATAGTNVVGAKGWSLIARCTLGNGATADIALGWDRSSDPPEWSGGAITGTLAPGGKIVADPPLAGLGPLARPDPADLPNNHLSYAVQWFLFALTALVIYGVALRSRSRR